MRQELRRALSNRQKRWIIDTNRIASAVLVIMYCKQGGVYLLFTKRAETVKKHKGQISFPGGVYQEGDRTLLETALRECAEEIGLRADDTEILGELDDSITMTSGYTISPFVAIIPWPYPFKVNREEIAEIIEVPILALLDDMCVSQQIKVISSGVIVTHFYHYRGEIIWGATAEILHQFLDIVAPIIKRNVERI